jgi:hypothetical protein
MNGRLSSGHIAWRTVTGQVDDTMREDVSERQKEIQTSWHIFIKQGMKNDIITYVIRLNALDIRRETSNLTNVY